MITDIGLGFLFSAIIATSAYRIHFLSVSGAIAAAILGTGYYVLGSPPIWFVILAFFISSSIWSRFRSRQKSKYSNLMEKTGCRDAVQVLANGGVGFIYILLYAFTDDVIFILGVIVSFSAANADTWASEIGILSTKKPVSMLTFKPIQIGQSGGVSWLGIAASLVGAAFMALVFWMSAPSDYWGIPNLEFFLLVIILFGFLGSQFDSFLGASIQGVYWDEFAQAFSDRSSRIHQSMRIHHVKVQGVSWINNDGVNVLSILFASVFAILGFLGLCG